MSALIEVILPVFLIIGAGYISVWSKIITESGLDGLMNFAQKFALPCLLFAAISRLDLGQEFDLRLLSSFYIAAIISFTIGLTGARMLFDRSWEDSVAIGFVALFSNSLLLGVPITERAYGSDALAANFAIISVHSPICYGLGITAMEIARARKSRKRFGATVLSILRAMFSNALVLGIALGFVVNLTGLPLPGPVWDALDLMIRAALPAALFGLGGVLYFYRPEGDFRTILFVTCLSLILHPILAYSLGKLQGLSTEQMRSMVVTAAMAPGVNAYIFASLYNTAKRVAASAVLLGTAASIFTAWLWLLVLP
ncbi:membrane transport protein [Actibacterium atlanticum]|uniref:Membrane transport protein n=1 Tax=Actibacterium atlanticum TaxID=1461693 RepID=A0A058ZJY7_9RHOB|nr:AEC family transporter [Actibacterium atlanticum]KCV81868.1 membrane transport protein [Actibacterium atlanticum]